MTYNLYLTLRGPAGITEAPNTNNPIEADNLAEATQQAIENSPKGTPGWIEVIGIRLIQTEYDHTS
jgi:hypothetical protein